jgi:sialic acid synthase SpsE
MAAVARKSLTTTRDLVAGTVLTTEMVALKRPGTGLPASLLSYVIGRTVRQDIKANSLLTWEILN